MMKYLWVNSHDICNCMWLGEYVYMYRYMQRRGREKGRKERGTSKCGKGSTVLDSGCGYTGSLYHFPNFCVWFMFIIKLGKPKDLAQQENKLTQPPCPWLVSQILCTRAKWVWECKVGLGIHSIVHCGLVTAAKTWEQPRYLSMVDGIKMMWCRNTTRVNDC